MAAIIPNEGITEMLALAGTVGSPTAFGYAACGSGTTAFSSTSSALNTEIESNGLTRAATTNTAATTTFADDTLQFVKTWTVTGTQSVTEIGITNKGTKDADGEKWLYLEVLSTARSLISGNTYTITVKIVGARAS